MIVSRRVTQSLVVVHGHNIVVIVMATFVGQCREHNGRSGRAEVADVDI